MSKGKKTKRTNAPPLLCWDIYSGYLQKMLHGDIGKPAEKKPEIPVPQSVKDN
jgi:hypothetical protein